jgi:hypothetical protein
MRTFYTSSREFLLEGQILGPQAYPRRIQANTYYGSRARGGDPPDRPLHRYDSTTESGYGPEPPGRIRLDKRAQRRVDSCCKYATKSPRTTRETWSGTPPKSKREVRRHKGIPLPPSGDSTARLQRLQEAAAETAETTPAGRTSLQV